MTSEQYSTESLPYGFGVFEETEEEILRSRILRLHYNGYKPEMIASKTGSTESHVRQVLGRRIAKSHRFVYAFDLRVGQTKTYPIPPSGNARQNKMRSIRNALARWMDIYGGEYELIRENTQAKIKRIA